MAALRRTALTLLSRVAGWRLLSEEQLSHCCLEWRDGGCSQKNSSHTVAYSGGMVDALRKTALTLLSGVAGWWHSFEEKALLFLPSTDATCDDQLEVV